MQVENSEDTDTGTLYENLVAAALEPLMEAVCLRVESYISPSFVLLSF